MGPIQKKWLKDLRSGKYEQVTGTLCNYFNKPDNVITIGYCCLGLAAKAAGIEENKACYFSFQDDEGNINDIYDYLGSGSYVLLGLNDKVGTFGNIKGLEADALSLVDLNDNLMWSFKQIADFIEKYEEKVFFKEV